MPRPRDHFHFSVTQSNFSRQLQKGFSLPCRHTTTVLRLTREKSRVYTVDAAGARCVSTALQAAVTLAARPDVATWLANA